MLKLLKHMQTQSPKTFAQILSKFYSSITFQFHIISLLVFCGEHENGNISLDSFLQAEGDNDNAK